MKELKGEGVDLFLSNGAYDELQKRFHEYNENVDVNEEIASYLGDKVDNLFCEDEKFQKYIEIYSEMFGLKGFALLEAERDDLAGIEEDWRDEKRAKRVQGWQGWIDKHDGKYACLFLCVPGINGYELKSAKSLLFIPDHGVSDRVFLLRSPLHGLIDMYIVYYYLNDIMDCNSNRIEKEWEE